MGFYSVLYDDYSKFIPLKFVVNAQYADKDDIPENIATFVDKWRDKRIAIFVAPLGIDLTEMMKAGIASLLTVVNDKLYEKKKGDCIFDGYVVLSASRDAGESDRRAEIAEMLLKGSNGEHNDGGGSVVLYDDTGTFDCVLDLGIRFNNVTRKVIVDYDGSALANDLRNRSISAAYSYLASHMEHALSKICGAESRLSDYYAVSTPYNIFYYDSKALAYADITDGVFDVVNLMSLGTLNVDTSIRFDYTKPVRFMSTYNVVCLSDNDMSVLMMDNEGTMYMFEDICAIWQSCLTALPIPLSIASSTRDLRGIKSNPTTIRTMRAVADAIGVSSKIDAYVNDNVPLGDLIS